MFHGSLYDVAEIGSPYDCESIFNNAVGYQAEEKMIDRVACTGYCEAQGFMKVHHTLPLGDQGELIAAQPYASSETQMGAGVNNTGGRTDIAVQNLILKGTILYSYDRVKTVTV